MKFPSNLNYDWKIVRETCSSCTDSCCPLFGMGLPQIIAFRKYFVDTICNHVIRLLASPDVRCKCNLIKSPNNNKHCGNICVYYVWYNQKLLISRNSQASLSYNKIPQSRHFPYSVIVHSTHFIYAAIFCFSLASQIPGNVRALCLHVPYLLWLNWRAWKTSLLTRAWRHRSWPT